MNKLSGLNEKALRRVGGYLGGREKVADDNRESYYSSARETAKMLLEEAKRYYTGDIDQFNEYVEELALQSAESDATISYYNALQILAESDNWMAVEEEGIADFDLKNVVTQAAAWAAYRDIMEYVALFRDEFVTDEEDF